jgi:integrase
MTRSVSMATLAKEYLAYRRKLGFALQNAGHLLLRFAEYADRAGHRGPLTTALAVRWARLPRKASAVYWARRLDVVRGFARYLAIYDPGMEVPPKGILGPAYRRITPHIYSEAELSALLATARRLPPSTGLRPHTYTTLFGLLACTGLRLAEALKLNRSDVDWQRGLLTIRETKFRKSRLVPLHASTTKALRAYADQRDGFHPVSQADAFFVSSRGTRLCHPTVRGTFATLRTQLSWSAKSSGRGPRIHDLRHAFACRRLLRWYEQGVDVDHAIAALSTYLGHADVNHTYWYLTGVPELLELVASRFGRFADPATGDQP